MTNFESCGAHIRVPGDRPCGTLRPGLRRTGAFTAALLLAMGFATTAAQARVETLRWEHPAPARVDGFRVHLGEQSGRYTRTIDVGKPAPDALGVFRHALSVEDGATVYVAVSAYRRGGEKSRPSNEQVRRAPAASGGSGTAPPRGGSSGNAPGSSGSGSSPSQGSPGAGSGAPAPVPDGDASALLSESLELRALGPHLPAWVDTDAGNSLIQRESLFEIRERSGNRMLSTRSTLTNIHSHFVGDGSRGWSAYEVSGRMRGSSPGSRLGVTAYSAYPSADVYYRFATIWQTGELGLYRHPVPDASFRCTRVGTGVRLAANRWIRFRMQVEPGSQGNALRAKAWPEGSPEPAVWSASCVDTRPDRPRAGTIGLWSGAEGTKDWDDLQVTPLGGAGSGPAQLGAPGRPAPVLR